MKVKLDLTGTDFDIPGVTQKLYGVHGSWRAVAAFIGYGSDSLWSQIANGKRKATREAARALYKALGYYRRPK